MGIEANVDAALEKLLEEGAEIPEDVLELERALLGESADAESQDEPNGAPSDEPDQSTDAGKEDEGKPADKPAEEDKSAEPDKPAEEDKSAEPDKPAEQEEKGPPKVVLRLERQRRHEAEALAQQREQELQQERERRERLEQELQELRSKLGDSQQKLQDKADEITGGGVELAGLTDEAIEAMRADLDDTVVDGIRALRDGFVKLQKQIESYQRREAELEQERERAEQERFQEDIDSVPILAVLQVAKGEEADALWKRASEYQKAVWADPDFADKSRREQLAEVGRRLERHLGPEGVKKWLGEDSGKPRKQDDVEDKLARARESAIPVSLSDLPAGTPAAATEMERVSAMSMFDLEEAIDKAYTKGGQEAVDELLAKYQTAER